MITMIRVCSAAAPVMDGAILVDALWATSSNMLRGVLMPWLIIAVLGVTAVALIKSRRQTPRLRRRRGAVPDLLCERIGKAPRDGRWQRVARIRHRRLAPVAASSHRRGATNGTIRLHYPIPVVTLIPLPYSSAVAVGAQQHLLHIFITGQRLPAIVVHGPAGPVVTRGVWLIKNSRLLQLVVVVVVIVGWGLLR
jgi:hypothetical protein